MSEITFSAVIPAVTAAITSTTGSSVTSINSSAGANPPVITPDFSQIRVDVNATSGAINIQDGGGHKVEWRDLKILLSSGAVTSRPPTGSVLLEVITDGATPRVSFTGTVTEGITNEIDLGSGEIFYDASSGDDISLRLTVTANALEPVRSSTASSFVTAEVEGVFRISQDG